MRGIVTRVASAFDAIDVIVGAGVALLAAGLAMVYVPAALIVTGVIFVGAGGYAWVRRARPRGGQ
jgi:hypothetical protein